MEYMKGKKNKTIKKIINDKIWSWIDTIEDEELKKKISGNVIVTGGSIASMALGEPVNDYDIYFKDKETTKKVAVYYADQAAKQGLIDGALIQVLEEERVNLNGDVEERIVSRIESEGVIGEELENEDGEVAEDECQDYRVQFISENAITLTGKIQIITRFFGDPEEIHRSFDFVHAMCYYDVGRDILSMPEEALRSMMSRTLTYRGSLYPICSVFRMRKFIRRGWSISAGQIFKICQQIGKVDFDDVDQLREQLTGVDQLYFNQLINALEDGTSMDETYIAEIIDRMES